MMQTKNLSCRLPAQHGAGPLGGVVLVLLARHCAREHTIPNQTVIAQLWRMLLHRFFTLHCLLGHCHLRKSRSWWTGLEEPTDLNQDCCTLGERRTRFRRERASVLTLKTSPRDFFLELGPYRVPWVEMGALCLKQCLTKQMGLWKSEIRSFLLSGRLDKLSPCRHGKARVQS